MIKRILVATDGSDPAAKAVAMAGDLAAALGAKVFLLYAVPSVAHGSIPAGYEDLADLEHMSVGDVLQAIGEEILTRAEGLLQAAGVKSVDRLLPSDEAAEAILAAAATYDIDMIVLGSRGLGNIEGVLLGSVSHKVSQDAPCSCLTVK